MPCVREVATRRARPALASQAEKASSIIGAEENTVDSVWKDHKAIAMYNDNIIASRQRRADNKCFRWKARPENPRVNAKVKLKCTGVIRRSWS